MGRWHGGHGGLALPLPGVRSSAKLAGGSDEFTMSRSAVACMVCQQAFWPTGLGGPEAQRWSCAAAWNSVVQCCAFAVCLWRFRGSVLVLRSRMEFDRALLCTLSM